MGQSRAWRFRERTELSPTTVSAITAALLDDGLIVPRQMGAVRDAARGRPRVLLELNPDAARVVGVKIAPTRIVHVVTDFQGDVLAELTQPVRVDRQPADVIADLVEDGVRRCVADAGLTLDRVESICVALPGVVEHATGLVRQSPILARLRRAVRQGAVERLGLSTLIESDANAITIGEHWFRHCRDLDDFVVVTVEHSLGLGVMHGGELFRGAKGISLNLGDLVMASGGNGEMTVSRLADQAAEPAILAPVAGKPRVPRGDPPRPCDAACRRTHRGRRQRADRVGTSRRRGARARHRQPHHAVRAAARRHRRLDAGARRAPDERRSATRSTARFPTGSPTSRRSPSTTPTIRPGRAAPRRRR